MAARLGIRCDGILCDPQGLYNLGNNKRAWHVLKRSDTGTSPDYSEARYSKIQLAMPRIYKQKPHENETPGHSPTRYLIHESKVHIQQRSPVMSEGEKEATQAANLLYALLQSITPHTRVKSFPGTSCLADHTSPKVSAGEGC